MINVRSIYEANFGKRIGFVHPLRTRALSLTGEWCALSCAHCNGQWLKGMSSHPENGDKVDSFLISGGCDINGRVPLTENLELLRNMSRKWRLIAHTGLISEEDAKKISPYIDHVSFNMVGDNETIKEVYGLKRRVIDFVESYLALKENVTVYPHITIGLRGGEISGEHQALEILKEVGAQSIVFNVLTPTPGTEYSNRRPPRVEQVIDVISTGRKKFPDTPLYLGCMRPGGRYRKGLDEEAVGVVNRIVMPADTATRRARELDYEIDELDECCIL